MKQHEPIDHYTDSSDDDICVVGVPRPPTPPKAKRVLGTPKRKDIELITINPPGDDDDDTDTIDVNRVIFSRVVGAALIEMLCCCVK